MRHIFVNNLSDEEIKAVELLSAVSSESYEAGFKTGEKKGKDKGYWTGFVVCMVLTLLCGGFRK